MSENIILRTDGLTKKFGGIIAVNNVDLAIEKGLITGIIGPNGAGKTTLFNNVSGYDTPTSGRISFNGQDITAISADKLTRIGMARTFQNIRLFKEMSVLENVMLGRHFRRSQQKNKFSKIKGIGTLINLINEEKDIRQNAWKWLRFMNLESYAKEMAKNLPYGKQKELEIARALATEPQLLFLDEPAAGMNPAETRELMSVIRQIKNLGITIVLIEHDMHLVMNICDRITVLNYGEKIAEGTPSSVQSDPLVIKAYLGD